MDERANSSDKRSGISIWIGTLFVAFALLAVGVTWLKQVKRGLIGSARIHLRGAMRTWEASGRPEGNALKGFMNKVPDHIFATNLVVTIDGKHMETMFATERLGFPGTLLITTNNLFIILEPDRAPRLLR
jgi:hypothetical protein